MSRPRRIGLLAAMLMLALPQVAWAQYFGFPTSGADAVHFYPTAYYDHSGDDWRCGGWRYSGHRGSDYGIGGFTSMDTGRDVTAAADGEVIAVLDGFYDRCSSGACGGGGGFGNHVRVRHGDGRISIYAHLKKWSTLVSVGQQVVCGQKLGEVGSSGNSTGPHLHFEVRTPGNVAVDPFHGPCSQGASLWQDQGDYLELPALACAEIPACEPSATLACGETVPGSNSGPDATSSNLSYSCAPYQYSGAETAYTFLASATETVTFELTGLSADLDLFVAQGAGCDDGSCIAKSTSSQTSGEQIELDVIAGEIYTVIVDGWNGAQSSFDLTASCPSAGLSCESTGTIECDSPIIGNNAAFGTTSAAEDYACTVFSYSGPEAGYSFTAPVTETIQIRLTGLQQDLDLFVNPGSTCDAGACVEASTSSNTTSETISLDVNVGETYTVMVDGWQGAVSDFGLEVQCPSSAACAPVDSLGCGSSVAGNNAAAGSTQVSSAYACTGFTYSGREIAYQFVAPEDGHATVTMTGLAADLDLMVNPGSRCAPQQCLAASTSPGTSSESISFDMAAGEVYTMVVEGWRAAASNFTLSVSCSH